MATTPKLTVVPKTPRCRLPLAELLQWAETNVAKMKQESWTLVDTDLYDLKWCVFLFTGPYSNPRPAGEGATLEGALREAWDIDNPVPVGWEVETVWNRHETILMGYELRYDGAVQQRSSDAADLFKFEEIAAANNATGITPEDDLFVAAANQREALQALESGEESTAHEWSDKPSGTIRTLGDNGDEPSARRHFAN